MQTESALRAALVAASLDLIRTGLNNGTAGNIAVRHLDGLLITPSGVPPMEMDPAMIAMMSMDGDWAGPCKPSSEWRLHRDILSHRPDVNAIVHTHSMYATILSTQHRSIPALHYMIAAFGGPDILCTPFAPFGTQALSDLIIEHLGERHGVLLGNHGMVVTGSSLAQAMWRTTELETLAKMYFMASMAGGAPVILSQDEIARTVARFADYGLTAQRQDAG